MTFSDPPHNQAHTHKHSPNAEAPRSPNPYGPDAQCIHEPPIDERAAEHEGRGDRVDHARELAVAIGHASYSGRLLPLHTASLGLEQLLDVVGRRRHDAAVEEAINGCEDVDRGWSKALVIVMVCGGESEPEGRHDERGHEEGCDVEMLGADVVC